MKINNKNKTSGTNLLTKDINEIYQRPSKKQPLKNPFSYELFETNESNYIFKSPTDVIYAFYGILKEASNMIGFSGGCGTIGYGESPYEIAYKLIDHSITNHITLEKFISTFKGVGHITLLNLQPLQKVPSTEFIKHYMVEIELITGAKLKEDENKSNETITYFAYYYGIISVIHNENSWYIQKIKYYPEDFLCAPYHSWFYDSNSIIKYVYMNDLKVIDKINNIAENKDLIFYYCSKDRIKYLFIFVRLTNGHEILISENIMNAKNQYEEINLIGNGWEHLKLCPQ